MNLAIRLASVQAGSCACVWGCVCRQACMQRLVHACLGSWVAGLLGLLGSCVPGLLWLPWVPGLCVAGLLARSPGFLDCYVS